MDTAEKLNKRYGFDGLSMNLIAEETGISKKGIYERFASKAELVDSIVYKRITTNKNELEERKRLAKNPIHEAFIIWHIIDEFVKDYNTNTVLQIQQSFYQTFRRIKRFKNKFLFELFKSNVDRGIREGLYRDTIKSTLISRYMLDLSFMSPYSVFRRAGYLYTDMDNQMLTYHLHGLATEKGAGLIRRYKNEALAQSSKYLNAVNDPNC